MVIQAYQILSDTHKIYTKYTHVLQIYNHWTSSVISFVNIFLVLSVLQPKSKMTKKNTCKFSCWLLTITPLCCWLADNISWLWLTAGTVNSDWLDCVPMAISCCKDCWSCSWVFITWTLIWSINCCIEITFCQKKISYNLLWSQKKSPKK